MGGKITQKDIENIKYLSEQYQKSVEEKSQPLFTLTAEEVEIVYNTLNGLKTLASIISPEWRIVGNEDSKETQIADNLLSRIKNWQDANNV